MEIFLAVGEITASIFWFNKLRAMQFDNNSALCLRTTKKLRCRDVDYAKLYFLGLELVVGTWEG